MCVFLLVPAAAGVAESVALYSAANIAANVAVIGGMAGTVMSTLGQYQQQQSANKQAQYQAQVAENNALTQKRLADYALEKGRLDEQRQRLQTARLKGQQRLGYAAAGVDMADGSPLDTLEDTAAMGELDALNVRHGAALDAWQHEAGASDAFAQAGLHRSSSASPLTQSLPTLVSGASGVADKWQRYAGK
jgi:hypothetical protein